MSSMHNAMVVSKKWSLFLIFILTVFVMIRSPYCDGKLFRKCDLLKVLSKFAPPGRAVFWLCIADKASGFNGSKISNTDSNSTINRNYGLFQIPDYLCTIDSQERLCDIKCRDLLNENLEGDIACAELILKNVTDILESWPNYWKSCSEITQIEFISECGPKAPVISKRTHDGFISKKYYSKGLEDPFLECSAVGIPLPKIKWAFDKNKFKNTFENLQYAFKRDLVQSRVFFPNTENLTSLDNFSCTATSIIGTESDEFKFYELDNVIQLNNFNNLSSEISPTSVYSSSSVYIIVFAVLGTFSLVIITILFIVSYARKKVVTILTKDEVNLFKNGAPILNEGKELYAHEKSHAVPYDDQFEIPVKDLMIIREEMLGKGQFGVVFKGKYKNETVAVKTIAQNSVDPLYLKSLLTELKVMIIIGPHLNIVSLIGAQTNHLEKGKLVIVVEYCPLGNLENYLRAQKSLFIENESSRSSYINNINKESNYENICKKNDAHVEIEKKLIIKKLYSWSLQIAAGMEHLHRKNVIHGDLATRNVLIFSDSLVKITDFGLSRQLYEYTNYVKKQQAPLPWRWMAYESLVSLSFSHKSDIWSYGVTLWEIFSFGDIPYPGLSWTLEFPKILKNGLRLLPPPHAPPQLWTLMNMCWEINPEMRPDFEYILREFSGNK